MCVSIYLSIYVCIYLSIMCVSIYLSIYLHFYKIYLSKRRLQKNLLTSCWCLGTLMQCYWFVHENLTFWRLSTLHSPPKCHVCSRESQTPHHSPFCLGRFQQPLNQHLKFQEPGARLKNEKWKKYIYCIYSNDEACWKRWWGVGMCMNSTDPHSKFQPCHHFLSLHLLPCHFSLVTPPTSHFLPSKITKLSYPPCLSPFPRTLPVLLLSALLPRHLSFHSHSSSAHLRPLRERPLALDVFTALRAGSLCWLRKGRRFVTRKCSQVAKITAKWWWQVRRCRLHPFSACVMFCKAINDLVVHLQMIKNEPHRLHLLNLVLR